MKKQVTVQNNTIYYLDQGQPESTTIVMLLHGASFNAQTWDQLGTLHLLNQGGHRTIAIDLPGYGQSEPTLNSKEDFLFDFITALELEMEKIIIVSPSMSGSFSFPLIIKHHEKLKGFVAIAPVGIPEFHSQLTGIVLPTLVIWGAQDRTIPLTNATLLCKTMPNAKKVILESAGHACYVNTTDEFHRHLQKFVESLK